MEHVRSKIRKPVAVLFSLLITASIVLQAMPAVVKADTATRDNVKVESEISGELNGPWTLTLKAQQTRAPEGYEVDWKDNSIIRLTFSNPIADNADDMDVTLSSNEASYSWTSQTNGRLEITGYDYSNHIGEDLVITISGLKVDQDLIDRDVAGVPTGEETEVSVLSSWNSFSANDGVHSIDFPDQKISVFIPEKPAKPQCDNRTISWDAVSGADGYYYECYPRNDYSKKITGTTTDTSLDMTDLVDENGADLYTLSLYAMKGYVKSLRNISYHEYYEVKVYPTFRPKANSTSSSVGTDGGTVSGTSKSGAAFTSGDNGLISGVFYEGDEITLTASPAEGYGFDSFQKYISDDHHWVDDIKDNPYTFTVVQDQQSMYAVFSKLPPVVNYVNIKLNMGTGHEELAASDKIKSALEAQGFTDISVSGSIISMKTATADDEKELTVYDVRSTLADALFSAFSLNRVDNNEVFFQVGRKDISQYGSSEDFYKELRPSADDPLISEGTTFYALWQKHVDSVSVSVEAPLCGTEVTAQKYDDYDEYDYSTINTTPVINIETTGVELAKSYMPGGGTWDVAFWSESTGDGFPAPFIGTILGGETYHASFALASKFGYYLDETTVVSIDGVEATPDEMIGMYMADVIAVHDPAAPVKENYTDSTYDEVVYCKHCGEKISSKTVDCVKLTIHASAHGNEDFADPIVLTVAKGTTIGNALSSNGYDQNDYDYFPQTGFRRTNTVAGLLKVPFSQVNDDDTFIANRIWIYIFLMTFISAASV